MGAYLAALDLSSFDPKAPPPQTDSFWEVVDSNRSPEDVELADVLDALGRPAAVTLAMIAARAPMSFADWIRDRKNSRKMLPYLGYGLDQRRRKARPSSSWPRAAIRR